MVSYTYNRCWNSLIFYSHQLIWHELFDNRTESTFDCLKFPVQIDFLLSTIELWNWLLDYSFRINLSNIDYRFFNYQLSISSWLLEYWSIISNLSLTSWLLIKNRLLDYQKSIINYTKSVIKYRLFDIDREMFDCPNTISKFKFIHHKLSTFWWGRFDTR